MEMLDLPLDVGYKSSRSISSTLTVMGGGESGRLAFASIIEGLFSV